MEVKEWFDQNGTVLCAGVGCNSGIWHWHRGEADVVVLPDITITPTDPLRVHVNHLIRQWKEQSQLTFLDLGYRNGLKDAAEALSTLMSLYRA